ncbi:hypothetical protein GOPIP_044_00290 [Gordonia polyisoprenivorans NBRC 16320 = JCM 10675]|uniref:STAS domain-containing protein n=2 Tax=Gordonia polyisoprenivorans TaxID=84595 RepID=A0A846WV80_9ACTN|nr:MULTISPECIES: STAS domain-containing protein [Gordonia]NKY04321.1 STAS domain-containing protein [Gordonia polyisoprenivorans]OPX13102.1 anti-anti-sigma factor [Gordonia sp. i37]GAB23340.1 hypothetical protein GOPIP_044_00290 [Gordonia polyisoprenivorans NBRC 16320 = JCM 10675]
MKQLDTNMTFHPANDPDDSAATYSAPHRDRASTPMAVGRSFCVQHLSGAIDMQTTADFAVALDRVLAKQPEGVVLDLTDVRFLSASGLGVLVGFHDEAAHQGIPVAVVGGTPIARPIRACAGETGIDVYDSVEAAGWAVITAAASYRS